MQNIWDISVFIKLNFEQPISINGFGFVGWFDYASMLNEFKRLRIGLQLCLTLNIIDLLCTKKNIIDLMNIEDAEWFNLKL